LAGSKLFQAYHGILLSVSGQSPSHTLVSSVANVDSCPAKFNAHC
jgi:hypothetical protein